MIEKLNNDNSKNSESKKRKNPIYVCVGGPKDFGVERKRYSISPENRASVNENFRVDSDNLQNVLWFMPPSFKGVTDLNTITENGVTYIRSMDHIFQGKEYFKLSAAISGVDSKDKFSEHSLDCLYLVVSGKDKNTGENISFLSHQSPEAFLSSDESKADFASALSEKLQELKDRCELDTLDAVMMGGIYLTEISVNKLNEIEVRGDSENFSKNTYLKGIEFLSKNVKESFGFEPTIVNGPKLDVDDNNRSYSEDDNVYFENKNRRLYFLRPKVNSAASDFVFSDVDRQKAKWKK